MNDKSLAKQIAHKVKEYHGRAYYVGGYVRDYLLNIENKDIDIEVYGISEDQLINILKTISTPISKGKSFGVYGLKGSSLDIALARKETKIGNKHNDFNIDVDPYIKPSIACLRRDFTINALMMDILTEEIFDYVGGIYDLKHKIIRHIDDKTFIEDPLRVLRACQFAARFDFDIDLKTKQLCQNIDISYISKERVEEETKKALLKAKKPSSYFNHLKDMNQLRYFYKPLYDLIDVAQNPKHHKEGDAYIHAMLALDNATYFKNEVSDQYKFLNLALYHDIGKAKTTKLNDKGYIQSINHEAVGSNMVDEIIYLKDKKMIKYLKENILYHMELNKLYTNSKNINKYCKLLNKVKYPKDLIYFSLVDKMSQGNRFSMEELNQELHDLLKVYDIYKERLKIDVITGDDLIKAGLTPNENFKILLQRAEELRMCNITKEYALKQLLK